MLFQPGENGVALKSASVDRHQRILHDLVGDGANELAGDIFFANHRRRVSCDYGVGVEMWFDGIVGVLRPSRKNQLREEKQSDLM